MAIERSGRVLVFRADLGWRLLAVAELTSAIERLQERMLTILGELDGTIDQSFTLTVERAEVEEIRRGLDEIEQLAQQGQFFAEAIPVEDLEVDYPAIAAAAATGLAQGSILDADRALLAASLLPRELGWHALAEGLQTTDAHTAWQETSLQDILGSFRGASPEFVQKIATSTRLRTDVLIADFEPDEIVRIATQLHDQCDDGQAQA